MWRFTTTAFKNTTSKFSRFPKPTSSNFNVPKLKPLPVTPFRPIDARSNTSSSVPPEKKTLFQKFFDPARIVGSPNFNRWLLVPPAILTHVCLGSVFAWSLMNDLIIRELGVVVSSAGDWTLPSVVPIFSTILGLQGISAAIAGKWQEEKGPRLSCVLGAFCYGGGLMIAGVGILTHQLSLVYLGYGVLGGIGMGLAYVPPIAMLIRWFPDRRGLATGMTLMGFGGGALVVTPIINYLLKITHKAPQYIGSVDSVQLITEGGRQFAHYAGELREVVVATTRDVYICHIEGLQEGVYLVGSGSTGAGATLFALGTGFLGVMLASAISLRTAPPNFRPAGWTPPPVTNALVSTKNVHIDTVMKTPQFWQIWLTLGTLSSAGMAGVSVAKTMMSEIFTQALPDIVTPVFTSTYIMLISAGNLGGRIGWSTVSDSFGRQRMFTMFYCVSIPLFAMIPLVVQQATATSSLIPLALFCTSNVIIYSFFGAAYAITPAYEADLFGSKYCGAIHGRMLTASSMASVIGPVTITLLRSKSELAAIKDLVLKIDPSVFYTKFGADVSQLDALVKAKTVTINKLMELVPAGTVDPTPYLYNSTMYCAAGLLCIGFVANYTIKPIDPKYTMIEQGPADPNSDSSH